MVIPRRKSEDPIDAYWSARFVPDKGYTWADNLEPVAFGEREAKGKPPFLVTNREAINLRRYEPFKRYPSLFRIFADLPFDSEAILDFANQYGSLGVGEACAYTDGSKNILVIGEGLNVWRDEILELSFLVKLWDIRQNDPTHLRNFIRFSSDVDAILFDGGIAKKRIIDRNHPWALGRGFELISEDDKPAKVIHTVIADNKSTRVANYHTWIRLKDPVGPITGFVADGINKRLEAHVSPRIMLKEDDQPIGLTVPRNLLGTMWLQFYQYVTGEQKIRKCLVCKHDMDVTESRNTKRMHDSCARREQMRRYHEKKRSKSTK